MSRSNPGTIARWWGPVFEAERVTRARRWQGYALRSVFVGILLLALALVWWSRGISSESVNIQVLAQVGSSIYRALINLQLLAVLLIAPAATAGAVCLDKSRGMLAHFFVTDLSNREIILGKLAARLLPVWGLMACALPVLALASLLGGIDPVALTGSFIITAGVAVLGCSFALMLSVWASKPHEVLSVVYGTWIAWILAEPIDQILRSAGRGQWWLERTNLFRLVDAPIAFPGETSLLEPILFALGCGLISAFCVGIAIARVRVVGCRSSVVGVRRAGWVGQTFAWLRGQVRWGKGPRLDANPVLWREWHQTRPSRWSRVVWGCFEILSAWLCGWLIVGQLLGWPVFLDEELPGVVVALLATIGLLLISTATASVLADERTRGSLDVLLTTPVSTRSIVWAKWHGGFRRVPRLVVCPLVVGIVAASVGTRTPVQMAIIYLVPVLIVAQGAALVSLGLALATWIKRTGQATAWTIALLMAAVVGWPILGSYVKLVPQPVYQVSPGPAGTTTVVTLVTGPTPTIKSTTLDWFLCLGSPACNVTFPMIDATNNLAGRRGEMEATAHLILMVVWTVLYGLLALVLFEATVRTFDRCLGRAPERPRPAPSPRVGRRRLVSGWIGTRHAPSLASHTQ